MWVGPERGTFFKMESSNFTSQSIEKGKKIVIKVFKRASVKTSQADQAKTIVFLLCVYERVTFPVKKLML